MKMRKFRLAILVLTACSSVDAWALCTLPPNSGCQDLSSKGSPPGSLDGVSPLRRAIITAALTQIGQVSAFADDSGNKCGADRLTAFYNTVYDKPLRKKDYETIKRPMSITTIPDPDNPEKFKAVVNQNKVNEWCGIFALWAVKTGARGFLADKPAACGTSASSTPNADLSSINGLYPEFAAWRPKKGGWGVDGLPFIYGTSGIQPGDIAYFKGDNRHHAVVERVEGDRIYTIDGNQECQTIVRQDRPLSSVGGFYRVE